MRQRTQKWLTEIGLLRLKMREVSPVVDSLTFLDEALLPLDSWIEQSPGEDAQLDVQQWEFPLELLQESDPLADIVVSLFRDRLGVLVRYLMAGRDFQDQKQVLEGVLSGLNQRNH